MTTYIHKRHRKPWLWRYRFSFTVAATCLSALLYFAFYAVGLVPQSLQYQPEKQALTQTTAPSSDQIKSLESTPKPSQHALPQHVAIPAVGINTSVLNPASRDTQVLNNYLNRGAVRYPGSGYPGNGNLFLFGHSTSRETVWNEAYKTFNNLEDVAVGDRITVYTNTGQFRYRVASKSFKKDSRAYVPLNIDSNMLTISTCDSFGSKEDRVVVRADFIDYVPAKSVDK